MITRITRGRLAPNAEGQVFQLLRNAAAASVGIPGLHSMSLSRTVEDGQTILVAVTVWTDLAAMMALVGPDWQAPSWMPGVEEYVVSTTVEILETVATSAEDLKVLLPAS
jgi:heme-degrading monooxygenase HmoA